MLFKDLRNANFDFVFNWNNLQANLLKINFNMEMVVKNTMKGYNTNQGYMGYIPGNGYILFCTEEEYEEYYEEYFQGIIETN